MRRAQKNNIKVCSTCITICKQSCNIIQKKRGINLHSKLNILYQDLIAVYKNILVSSLNEEIREIHRMEFKDALHTKKLINEHVQKVDHWDVDWIKSHGMSVANVHDPDIIQRALPLINNLCNGKIGAIML